MITLFIYSIKSALVLALLYLPYTLMLRQESFFRMNRITLLTILMLALVLPMVDIPSLATSEQPIGNNPDDILVRHFGYRIHNRCYPGASYPPLAIVQD